jgi:hypothetical protein
MQAFDISIPVTEKPFLPSDIACLPLPHGTSKISCPFFGYIFFKIKSTSVRVVLGNPF